MARARWQEWTEQVLLHPEPQAGAVLGAALRLFDQNGFSATTIEDIRLQADVSVGTVYHHFGNKEGLAVAVYLQSLIGYQRGLVAEFLDDAPTERVVRAVVAAHLRWVAENPARGRCLARRRETESLVASEREIDALNRRTFARIEVWYRPRVEAGEIRALEQPLRHAVWLGPVQEYTRLALERSHWLGSDALLAAGPALADAAWAALRP